MGGARDERARVAVVIVSAGGSAHLERALASLREQTCRPARSILVDNASDPAWLAGVEAAHPELTVVPMGRNAGFAAANNEGIRVAEGCELVALLNPDAFPEPSWLEELVSAAEREPAFAVFGSRLVSAAEPEKLDGTGDVYHVSGFGWPRDRHAPVSTQRERGEIFSASAAAALYRKAALDEVGGFDERLFCYYEDFDLAFRLRLLGHRCLHVPEAVGHHVGSASAVRDSDFLLYHTHRNLIWVYAKNMPSPLLWLYLVEHVLLNLLALGAFALKGRLGVIVRAKRDALRGLPDVLAERRRVQARRRVGALAIRRAMARGVSVLPVAWGRARELPR